jgi:hypothetical protein
MKYFRISLIYVRISSFISYDLFTNFMSLTYFHDLFTNFFYLFRIKSLVSLEIGVSVV